MKTRLFVILLVAILPAKAFSANYKVDASHSKIGFKVRHLGISSVVGHFGKFEGSFSFDPSKIAESKAAATIQANSVDTDHVKRDDHLRSAEFLNTSKNPKISFQSKKVSNIRGEKFTVEGDLSINGVTKQVTLDVEFGGAVKDPWGKERAAFSASTVINRKDFGLTWNKLLETGGLVVGEEVTITLEIEGIKEAA